MAEKLCQLKKKGGGSQSNNALGMGFVNYNNPVIFDYINGVIGTGANASAGNFSLSRNSQGTVIKFKSTIACKIVSIAAPNTLVDVPANTDITLSPSGTNYGFLIIDN